jgi:hypothetical protein
MYKIKYLKYKNKYLNLLKQIGGGCDNSFRKNTNMNQKSTNMNRLIINGYCYLVKDIFIWIFHLGGYNILVYNN